MTEKMRYRLAGSTAAEPLVNRWVAWSHLLPPVPASLHLTGYQLKLLRSYLEDPSVHARACQNPKLRSGRFVDVPAARAGEVRDFLAATESGLRANVELAKGVMEFQDYLLREAKGLSLDEHYAKLPEPLRGYVELTYDYHHRPAVRFFEGMLYHSPYYRPDLQSLRLFRQRRDDARAFIMSTPRLPEPDCVDWEVPFASPLVDEFFKLETEAQPLGYVRELLGLPASEEDLLATLLTAEPARAPERRDGTEARIRYFGHACVLVEWRGVSVLTDPYVGLTPAGGGIERYSYEDLPEKIDYVLITHNHHDHFCLETLLRLRRRIGCLVVPRSTGFFYGDLSLKLLAQRVGFRNVVELDALESLPLPDGEIVGVPFLGEHADLPHGKSAYVVRTGARQTLFAADSDCLDQRVYEHVRRALGPVDTVFIGMECVGAPLSWSCGPFFPAKPDFAQDQSRRYKGSDSYRAQKILEAVEARRLYVYAMGMEPWFEPLLGLAYTDDAVQIRESTELLRAARGAGFDVAARLFGKGEIALTPDAPRAPAAAPAAGPPAEAPEAAEDEFVFD
jgi:L-ascorbate metabolism protein UlaG (beta-lactamase superfamily)